MKRIVIRAGALVLLATALAGGVYGVRAAIAQSLYFGVKFGEARDDLSRTLADCERASRLYSPNYYFAMWAGERAYYHALGTASNGPVLESAARWCDRGLELNPYRSSLRLLKTRLLRLDSLEAATAYWETYVDWNFWNPHHHAILAELYASGGRWGRAMRALSWVKGSPHEAEARARVNEAWRRQLAPPPSPAP